MSQEKKATKKLAEFYAFVGNTEIVFADDAELDMCNRDFLVTVSPFVPGMPLMVCIFRKGVIEPAISLNIGEKGDVSVVKNANEKKKQKKGSKQLDICLENYIKEDIAVRAADAVMAKYVFILQPA